MNRTVRNPVLTLLFFWFICVSEQSAQQQPLPASSATITFTFDHPDLDPSHYVISVDSACQSTFNDSAQTSLVTKEKQEELDPISFKLSAATCAHIFDLVRSLNYMAGNYDYTRQRIAFAGKKTITYTDAQNKNTTSLNWSENNKMMDLVQTFEGIAGTLILGRRLIHLYKYQILGLDKELARAEVMVHDGFLKEISLIESTLKAIAEDTRVINIARQRARRLLAMARS